MKLQEEQTQILEAQRRKEEHKKRQAEKRTRLAAEENRLKEMQRLAMEELEDENRRQLARQAHEKEVQLAEIRTQRLEEQKRKLAQDEIERNKKAVEHRKAVQKFFADEQFRLRERLENMNLAEKKKHDALMKKQAEHAEQLRIRREKIEKRIEINMSMAQKIEEKRKFDFIQKQVIDRICP